MAKHNEALELNDNLKDSNLIGPSGIQSRMYTNGSQYEIADLLTKICNLSLKSASVSEDQKTANITPMLKKVSMDEAQKL